MSHRPKNDIEFTLEMEKEQLLPFLGLLLSRKERTLELDVYTCLNRRVSNESSPPHRNTAISMADSVGISRTQKNVLLGYSNMSVDIVKRLIISFISPNRRVIMEKCKWGFNYEQDREAKSINRTILDFLPHWNSSIKEDDK